VKGEDERYGHQQNHGEEREGHRVDEHEGDRLPAERGGTRAAR
jgi:hypothetical protein